MLKNISFYDKGKNYNFQEKVGLLYKEDFLKYLTFAGLEVKAVFGDYQLTPFDSIQSDRLILIATKIK